MNTWDRALSYMANRSTGEEMPAVSKIILSRLTFCERQEKKQDSDTIPCRFPKDSSSVNLVQNDLDSRTHLGETSLPILLSLDFGQTGFEKTDPRHGLAPTLWDIQLAMLVHSV